jgi:phosphoglucomutase
VKRLPFQWAQRASTTHRHEYMDAYICNLTNVVNLQVVRSANVKFGVDPLGGAGVHYWGLITDRYKLPLTLVNEAVDPTFRFMTLDWGGKIRMDCSSPYVMQRLIALKDRFDVAWACDTDHDRHGIMSRSSGLLNPNQFLAVAIWYLFSHRPAWPENANVGKTVVSSGLIDRVVASLGRRLVEVLVGFKWFVDGLLDGSLAFGGEESGGAAFLRRDGTVWTTDKDGMIMGLLAAEMTAVMGRDPGELYQQLTRELGEPVYQRIDAPATPEHKRLLAQLTPQQIEASELAGEKIIEMLTAASGDRSPLGGLKVVTATGWFAARPSGAEDVYKIYAESFQGEDHLRRLIHDARALIDKALAMAPQRSSGGGLL